MMQALLKQRVIFYTDQSLTHKLKGIQHVSFPRTDFPSVGDVMTLKRSFNGSRPINHEFKIAKIDLNYIPYLNVTISQFHVYLYDFKH